MALTRLKTWISGEILTHTDLNGEFDNFINNAASLFSPFTSNIDSGGFRLIGLGAGSLGSPSLQFTSDTNTGIWSSAADTVDVSTGGSRALQLGASALISASPEDSRTSSVDTLLELRSTTSSSPAAGIGTGLLFSAESADENPSNVGEVDFAFSDITAGSEDSYMDILLRTAGAALGTRYRFQATGAFNGIFTHANTATRTYTLPDNSVNLGTTGTKSVATLGTTFSTTSTSFVDVTSLSVTLTTGANRCLIIFSGSVNNTNAAAGSLITIDQDGSNIGSSNGIVNVVSSGAGDSNNGSFSILTDVLSAASHTFKVQLRADSGTANVNGNPTARFAVMELA